MERTVYGFGETIFDIIFQNNQPQAAKAGGSTFNALVSLGRLEVKTSFISKIGDDPVGQIIYDFMHQNNISTECVEIRKGDKTDIALAFLNDKNDASYSFYKEYNKQQIESRIPDFNKDDILLFGSYFSLNPLLRPLLERIIEAAKAAEVIIYYDPNFRDSHLNELKELQPSIFQNIKDATITRGSDEDFHNILGLEDDTEVFSNLKDKTQHLIITKAEKGVEIFDRDQLHHFPTQSIKPVSTIGAGDNFNAGFIYALLQEKIGYDEITNMSKSHWSNLVNMAIAFSSNVCCSFDNYISLDFANTLKRQ
jgi:fructokinase